MKLKIRIDKQNSRHVHFSVFGDDDCGTLALLGTLVMTWKEYHAFVYILREGAKGIEKYYEFSIDTKKENEK